MADDSDDKSHEPTAHRREEARNQGQVAVSQDLGSAALLLGGLLALLLTAAPIGRMLGEQFRAHLGGDAWLQIDGQSFVQHWNLLTYHAATSLMPLLAAAVGLGLAVHWLQTGWMFLPDKLQPDFGRINPLSGIQRLFSLSNVVRLAFGVVKIIVVGVTAWNLLVGEVDGVLAATNQEIGQFALYLWEICLWTSIKIAAALLILALLDYGYQWWKQEQDLRMSSQEIREEMRNMQGDPQTIARRKSVQRQLAMNRSASAVPGADVVITNPTELAIAVQYDAATMAAPVVVAKGAGMVAQKIRRIALENGVPIVEKKPLAQALYKDVEVGQPIPAQMYAAVAEVLAYVYQLKGKSPSAAA